MLPLVPLLVLVALVLLFGSLAPRFLTLANLAAILNQSSWLIVVALGVNFVLLTAGVDLSLGSVMYLAAVVIGLALPGVPVWAWPLLAICVGALAGLANALFVARFALPAFIVTLALAFILRGVGLWLSSTQMIFADPAIAELGRTTIAGLGVPVLIAIIALFVCWTALNMTPFGIYVRALGSDAAGAERAGVPTRRTLTIAYMVCGGLAGVGGFVSFAQTSAVTASFGLNAEFLAIAAAVLGGTSLFGGRGSAWGPALGAVLITTVQNGLVLIDANPYAYPVVTGAVIFLAALFDSLRARLRERAERRPILVARTEASSTDRREVAA
jgi:ribose transport system permease protein